MAKKRKNYH